MRESDSKAMRKLVEDENKEKGDGSHQLMRHSRAPLRSVESSLPWSGHPGEGNEFSYRSDGDECC